MKNIMTVEELIKKLENYKDKGLYVKVYGGDRKTFTGSGFAYLSVTDKQCNNVEVMRYEEHFWD